MGEMEKEGPEESVSIKLGGNILLAHGSSLNPVIQDFMEISFSRHDGLKSSTIWRLNSISCPSPLPGGWDTGTESSNLLITWLVFLITSPHPETI